MNQQTFSSLETFKNIPLDKTQYPIEFIKANGAILLKQDSSSIYVGITENTSISSKNIIKNFHNKPVSFVSIQQADLSSWLSKKYEDKESAIAIQGKDSKNESLTLDKLANDAPTINLVNSLFIDAIRNGASDIHIESGEKNARVRYRVDGVLKTVRTIDNERFSAVSSRIKIMSNLNILEKRQPQDGRITVTLGKDSVDLRISIVPITSGESIVMRILGKASSLQTLDDLGFSTKQLNDIRSMMKIPHGLILVTGPTGSGKTTTLNAMMRELVSDEIKIISIEDPVEFLVEGVDQIQINEQIGLGFDSILRRVLRQDPNIIMVGEIRDKPTAELSIRAALTGHLVLSTLHTNDSISVIPRLINMGIEPYLIASVLKGAVAQRLVRKYKKKSKEFSGRTVISETFTMDEKLENLISRNAEQVEIEHYLRNKGMIFLADDAKNKIAKGITTKQETSKEVNI